MGLIEDKKEYLSRYGKLCDTECDLLDKINLIRSNACSMSISSDGIPHGSCKSDLSDYAVMLDNYTTRLHTLRDLMYVTKKEMLSKIDKLSDRDEQLTLKMRYIYGLQINTIAVILGVKKSKAYNIHNSAIDNFKL